VYYERYNGEQATFDAFERAIDNGDTVEILDYRYPDPQEFCEGRGIYDGEHRSYSVDHNMISDCSVFEPVMVRVFID
jgi:hypothetical protein